MFDLPESPAANPEGNDDLQIGEQQQNDVVSGEPSPVPELISSVTMDDAAHVAHQEPSQSPELVAGSTSVSAEQVESEESAAEEDNAWTRRLRELSQLVTTEKPSPSAPPVPPATAKADEPVGTPESAEVDDFSIETQLARLLGKPLRPNEPAVTNGGSAGPGKQDGVSLPDILPMELGKPAEHDDRTHLMEKPRHPQNKNAVREEVQSFRVVAQCRSFSARQT